MNQNMCARVVGTALLVVGPCFAIAAAAQDENKCKPVHADLVEARSTVGCKPEHSFCFLGEVDGNHGLRGTTYFRGDSGAAGPSTSPGFISYSGQFEYITDRGMLVMRETGVVNQTQGNPESGVVTAYQKIVDATGDFSGVTGYFFVSGFNRNQRITTQLTGEICYP
jgi:hypothetical protein